MVQNEITTEGIPMTAVVVRGDGTREKTQTRKYSEYTNHVFNEIINCR